MGGKGDRDGFGMSWSFLSIAFMDVLAQSFESIFFVPDEGLGNRLPAKVLQSKSLPSDRRRGSS